MPLILDKILGLLAMPLGSAAALGALACVAFALGRTRTAAGLLAFMLVWLWTWSTPLVGQAVIGTLSNRYPPQRAEAYPPADAIVVLGGGIRPISGDLVYPDLGPAADRVLHAARLYQAGKAPLIILSAGNVWGDPDLQSEAEATRMLLGALGVPRDAVAVEGSSRNTRQNAILTAELAGGRGIRRILLVTSAWHMPRALATFRRTELDIVPAATDHARPGAMPWILRILPQTSALALSTCALKEYLGLLVYRLREWA